MVHNHYSSLIIASKLSPCGLLNAGFYIYPHQIEGWNAFTLDAA